jgi:antitoxin (DNA-binding transcriptional repressor) of toxin-antitoxin stability system
MKEVTIEQLPHEVGQLFDSAQSERVLVTRNGKPIALVVGVEHKDEEDYRLELSPEFWRMIEERRREPTIPWEDLKAELFPEEKQ